MKSGKEKCEACKFEDYEKDKIKVGKVNKQKLTLFLQHYDTITIKKVNISRTLVFKIMYIVAYN